jgi:predicted metal-dependent enzyme (double-stranded beta helix superfamily)
VSLTDLSPTPVALPALPRRGRQAALHHLVRRLAGHEDLWHPHVSFDRHKRHAARIAAAGDYEVWLLTWLRGQSTGLHDHGDAAGAFAVLSGELVESTLNPAGGSNAPVLVERSLVVGRVRSFAPGHVHDVAHAGGGPAITLHAYAPVLSVMRRFVLDDDGRPSTVAVEKRGVDW